MMDADPSADFSVGDEEHPDISELPPRLQKEIHYMLDVADTHRQRAQELTRRAEEAIQRGRLDVKMGHRVLARKAEAIVTEWAYPEYHLWPEGMSAEEQYHAQLDIFEDLCIVERRGQSRGFVDINGDFRRVPTYDTIMAKLATDSRDAIRLAVKNGIAHMMWVPFGMPNDRLITHYAAILAEKSARDELKDSTGGLVRIKEGAPIYSLEGIAEADVTGALVYRPKVFHRDKLEGSRDKRTKAEIIPATRVPGVQVINLAADPAFEGLEPPDNEYPGGVPPRIYREYIYHRQHRGLRTGMNLETWLTQGILTAANRGQVIDDKNQLGAGCYLIDCMLLAQNKVLVAYFDSREAQVRIMAVAPDIYSQELKARAPTKVL